MLFSFLSYSFFLAKRKSLFDVLKTFAVTVDRKIGDIDASGCLLACAYLLFTAAAEKIPGNFLV